MIRNKFFFSLLIDKFFFGPRYSDCWDIIDSEMPESKGNKLLEKQLSFSSPKTKQKFFNTKLIISPHLFNFRK
jgi:hypothetical protein